MATLAQLEEGVKKAYEAGNMDYARILGAELVRARGDKVNQIPGMQVQGTTAAENEPEPTLIDKAVGTGEAALSTLTGLTGGTIGMAGGTVAGIAKSIKEGTFGTQKGVQDAEQMAMRGAQALTYEPRTQSGQEQAAVVGGAMQNLVPLAGVAAELGALQAAAKPSAVQAVNAVRTGAKQAGAAVIERLPTRAIQEPTPQPGMVSVGSAATNPIEQARAIAAKASPQLQAAVEDVIKRKEPLNLTAIENHAQAETLPVPMRMSKGQATQDPILISEEINARGKNPEFVALFDEQNKGLIDNVNAIKEKAAPDVYMQSVNEHGDALISAYEALDNQLQTQVRANYKALEQANNGKFPLDTQAFVKAAEENLTKKNRNHFLPAEVRSIVNQYKDGLEMDFNGFEELRTILASEARKADRAGDGNRAAAVGAVRKALEELPMSKESEALKILADAARASAKQRFDMIKSDSAFKSVLDGKAAADTFITKHVINADSGKVETMLRNLSFDPTNRQVAASAAVNWLKQAAKVGNDEGTFAQASFNNAMSKLGKKLDLLLDQENANSIKQLGDVARKIKQQPSGSFVNNSNTATALIAEGAKSTAEGVVNALTGALSFGNVKGGTGVRKLIEARKAARETADSLREGAGISAKESKLLEVKRKVLEAEARKKKF